MRITNYYAFSTIHGLTPMNTLRLAHLPILCMTAGTMSPTHIREGMPWHSLDIFRLGWAVIKMHLNSGWNTEIILAFWKIRQDMFWLYGRMETSIQAVHFRIWNNLHWVGIKWGGRAERILKDDSEETA